MRISATDNKPPRSDAGFTLVEVMVALLIVGLTAGAVLLMWPGSDTAFRDAATRLAVRLKAAADQSVLINREVALVVTNEGYGFERREEEGWRKVDSDRALAFQAWPAGARPRVENPAGPMEGQRVAKFDPLGGSSPMLIVLDGASTDWAVEIDTAGAIHVDRSN